ncbi:NUDIX domain-containing protein [Streptomyces sp. MNP-20]|uniref:NUDIX hydrolase n=1 Tax=Streptomyces sp. MNP-20 TaxID=2721165 RepID=UPI00155657E7|nr:NUDIX domain-containing protein [Streptomyces sp. MNP-20]
MDRFTSTVDLHLVLRDDQGRVALGRRRNTGYMDGYYHVPAGHLEAGESFTRGAARELREETGALVEREELRLAHTMHHFTNSARTALFFEVTRPTWELANPEHDKCEGWEFFAPDALPDKIVPYTASALGHIAKHIIYSERGWENAS